MAFEIVDAGSDNAEPAIPIAPAPAKEGAINARDAMRSVMDWRRKNAAADNRATETQATEQRQESAAPEPATESTEAKASDDAAAAQQQPPGETESADRASFETGASRPPQDEEVPPIEPLRSWSKEDKELFKGLPRETQERLADRERSRDSDFSRRQQEATEKAKALEAERSKVEQARTQYEAALPQLLETLQQSQAGEFADIKTIADVEKLAREDWPRYLQWDLAQKKIAAVHQEMVAAEQRQAQEKASRFSDFARREDALFAEKVPDMAEPEKAARLQKQALTVLKDLGFSDDELGQSWNGQKDLSLRDHRLQLIIRDAILWRDAQARAKTATTKPVPPVQRPGAAQDKSASREQQLQNLSKGIETKSGLNAIRAAAQFVAERRRAG